MPCGRPSLFSIFVSMALAIAAVSSTGKSGMEPVLDPPQVSFKPPRMWDSPFADPLVMNASAALRNAGYHIIGAAFQMFAVEVLPSRPATFFAINDPAVVNTTLPSWLMLNLLRYHTATEMLLWKDLQLLTADDCLPTGLHGKGLVVTAVQTKNSTVALNGVVVSHPEIFAVGGLTIHGVHRPFYYFDRSMNQMQFDSLPFPSCDLSDFPPLPNVKATSMQPRHNATPPPLWRRLQLALRVNGCLSFAVAMNLQIERLKARLAEATRNSGGRVTVFAPIDGHASLSSASALVGDKLTFHVVPQRLTMADLRRLPPKHNIPALFRGHNLEITFTGDSRRLLINGVTVVRPDAFVNNDFVLHGIFPALDLLNVTTAT